MPNENKEEIEEVEEEEEVLRLSSHIVEYLKDHKVPNRHIKEYEDHLSQNLGSVSLCITNKNKSWIEVQYNTCPLADVVSPYAHYYMYTMQRYELHWASSVCFDDCRGGPIPPILKGGKKLRKYNLKELLHLMYV